jgi:hypothetical protein
MRSWRKILPHDYSFPRRTLMLLPRKAHREEVTVSVWPKILKEICARKDIHVLE